MLKGIEQASSEDACYLSVSCSCLGIIPDAAGNQLEHIWHSMQGMDSAPHTSLGLRAMAPVVASDLLSSSNMQQIRSSNHVRHAQSLGKGIIPVLVVPAGLLICCLAPNLLCDWCTSGIFCNTRLRHLPLVRLHPIVRKFKFD